MAIADPTNLTRCLRLPGFFPGGQVEQFLRVIPFHEVDGYGRQVQINRVSTQAGAAVYAPGAAVDLDAGATSLTTFDFRRIGGTAEVDSADEDASSPDNDLLELQVEMKKVTLLRTLAAQIITGDGTGNNLAGLNALITGGQEVDAGAMAPTLADYHLLVSLVTASDGALGAGPDALVMNRNARRQLIGLLEGAAGGGACYSMNTALGVPVLQFEGLPVYVSDSIPLAGAVANETSIYALKLLGATGVRILHVGGSSEEFGVVVEDVPPQLTAAKRARTVRGYYSLLLPEVASAARMVNAVVPTP